MSGVRCHVFGEEEKNGASWWRVCYQRGLPILVYTKITTLFHLFYSISSPKRKEEKNALGAVHILCQTQRGGGACGNLIFSDKGKRGGWAISDF